MLILTFILGGTKLVNLGQQNIHGCHGAMRHAILSHQVPNCTPVALGMDVSHVLMTVMIN
jgi:hypothetical protein